MPKDAVQLILDLWKHDGIEPLSKLPGLWERKLDDRWTLWVNGHGDAMPTKPDGGFKLEPYCVYVEFNGWPWGNFAITGQGCIGAGALANYETFCDALRRACAQPIGEPS